ncbi:carbonic anhydrase family protein [Biformimicrobium ophioploci]|uniref:Carbonic anhydrase n=2 Tax=Biformimicrobium ophioploci TaxID=3036711 RepID=A0ABQ6LXR5_9GAMM|nr:carbonic anhydrase family protein [Microbulbifer sp. NKW57]
MKKVLLGAAFAGVCGALVASEGVEWGYSGDIGPKHWGGLSPEFSPCAFGKNQSPIDIKNALDTDLPELDIRYRAGGHEVVNLLHTMQVNYIPGSNVEVKGKRYHVTQFHFHAPSENHIDGKSFPMEMHIVNVDEDGNLAVLAVMLEEGEENPVLAEVWKRLPKKAGGRHRLKEMVNVADMLPENLDYFRFSGSLTTPPCSEGVIWVVLKSPVSASAKQIELFKALMPEPNNRPIQPLNARKVLQ